MDSIFFHDLIYIILGMITGLMAGVLGIGGGIIVVPGLVFVFQLMGVIPQEALMHVAAGTSLAIMIFTSMASLRAHLRLGDVLWSLYKELWPGIVLGVLAGGAIAALISTHVLKIIFSLFLLFILIKMFTDVHVVAHEERTIHSWLNRLISFFIGSASGLLGIGGGVLMVPFLTYKGVPPRKIPGISTLCTLTVALTGTLMFVFTGQNELNIPQTTGYIYWPAVFWVAIPSSLIAPLGAKLNYILPVKQLKYLFLAILLITAIKMLF